MLYVFYITTTPYLPCNNNNINRKELYDFYYTAITLTTRYNYLCRLRIRVKGLQQVIDSQGTKIASLLTEREMTALGHADESTGQGMSCECHVI